MKLFSFLLLLIFTLGAVSFAGEPIQPIPKSVEFDKQKAELGKLLFFDPSLSKDGTISCSSCHSIENGGTDNRSVSIGIDGQEGKMNSPTVLNSVFNFRQFWNGRAKNLKEQAKQPILNPIEMGMTEERLETVLNGKAKYKKFFKDIYGKDRVTLDDVADAIKEFEKTLITPDSKFDKFLRGEGELSTEEEEGYKLFKTLGCISCHNGRNVGGNSFQIIGIVNPYPWTKEVDDVYKLTRDSMDKNRFKTPGLRNVELTFPYFHDGSIETLKEAVIKMAYHNLGLSLSEEEVTKLVAFLRTLTGKLPEISGLK